MLRRSYVPPLRVEFLFPPVLWNSCDQTLLAFKARFSGGSSSHCQTPRLGSLMWCWELSLLWENLCGIIIFQFLGCPPSRYGICFYHNCTPPPPSHCGFFFVFICRVSFLVGSSVFVFVNGCLAVSCEFGVFIRSCELTSFYSAIFSASPPVSWKSHLRFFPL